jgi:hypothetical protein
VQNEYGNPPSPTGVTFYSTTGVAPVYSVGTSDTYPFGFTYPTISAYGLNSQGGITGIQSGIGGNDPNLGATNTLNYTATLERSLGTNLSVAAGYSGSHSTDLYSGFASRTTNANYGVDINTYPGSLIQNNGQFIRLNTSFGSVRYTVNGPTSSYNAFIGEVKGRFLHKGFIDASYTHSASYDDAGTYPTIQSTTGNWSQYWSRSNWDTPNRLSMQISYELPSLHHGLRALRMATEGWRPSEITILQTGTPFSVLQTSAFAPVCSTGTATKGVCPAGTTVVGNTGGDYNADGNSSDLPNAPAYGYNIPTDRKSRLNGVFKVADFAAPAFNTGEGNEAWNGYRNPGYANTDFSLNKATHITEKVTFSLRAEVFNLFNRASLGGISSTLTSSTFGKVSSQYNARFLQVGGRLEY